MRNSILSTAIIGVTLFGCVLYGWSEEAAKEKSFVYKDHDKRDPFWTLLGRKGAIINYDKDIQISDMVLEGIMAEPGGDSAAIINGNIVVVGDKVGFFVVKEIQPYAVILEKGQEAVTLKLKKEE